jgi:hypothetical protein
MKLTAFVSSYTALDNKGIYCPKGFTPWGPEQKGPEDIQRPQVLSTPYPPFGKLCLPEKLVFSASSLLLDGITNAGGDRSGICIGLPYGSLSTDLQFAGSVRSGFPSPAIFSATLPSSPLAEVAITYGFKGPDRVFAGGDFPCLSAFDESLWLMESGKADIMISVSVWAVDKIDRTAQLAQQDVPMNQTYALLLSRKPLTAAARRLTWETSPNLSQKQGPASGPEQELFSKIIHVCMNGEKTHLTASLAGFHASLSFD